MSALLLFGEVMHTRLRPRRNRFRYPVFALRVALDRLQALRGPLLAVDRWHLFSIHRRDHGPRDGSDLLPWIRALLAREGLHTADGEVWLQAFPRVLGYVFNPVSFWFCHDREGRLRAVLCEVNNTFGERHNYLVAHADQRPILPGDALTARKVFHVSPFCAVEGHYRFRFALDAHGCDLRIDYHDRDAPLLFTALRGRTRPLTTGGLLLAFVRYPWMTLTVIARIHWQAVRLWAKGVPLCHKPPMPSRETTR